MLRGKKITREQVLLCVIGFFVGRAVCFHMNPLAAAFFTAAHALSLSSVLLACVVLLGIASTGSASGVVSFLLFVFLFFVVSQVFARQKQTGTFRLCLMAGVCLFAAQMGSDTFFGSVEHSLFVPDLGRLSYMWENRRTTLLAFMEAALESVLVTCLSYIFTHALSKKEWQLIRAGGGNRKLFISGVILFMVVLYGLPGTLYDTFAVAECIGYLAILVVAYMYGLLESTLVGALAGAVLAYQLQDFSVLGLVTLFGVCAGAMKEMGRIGVFLGMALVVLLVQFGIDDVSLASNSLKGLVSAGAIFLLLPKDWLIRQQLNENEVMDLLQEQLGRSVREKMRDFAGGFYKLSTSLDRLPKPENCFSEQDISTMYMQMKENVCDQCSMRKHCEEAPEQTYRAARSIFQALEKRGGLCLEDIPQEFSNHCSNQKSFMIGANISYERAKSNHIIAEKLVESREILAAQVGDIARQMNDFSSELMEDCGRDESFEILLRIRLKARHVNVRQVLYRKRDKQPDLLYVVAQCPVGHLMTAKELATHISRVYQCAYRPVDGCKAVVTKKYEVYVFEEEPVYRVQHAVRRLALREGENGDNFSYLEEEHGRFYAMLSDGMGTGAEAGRVSALLIELLEEFLEAGFQEDMAIKLAHSVLAMDDQRGSYATLDFFRLDLFSGVARMVKVGAAATYIKQGSKVDLLVSTSLPAGVFCTMDCDAMEFDVRDGDMIIMVSDGVMDLVMAKQKELFLKEQLEQIESKNPETVAQELYQRVTGTELSAVKDDMTILAFSIWKK